MNRPIAALLACAIAMPALAQDAAGDWDLHRDPRKKMVLAYTAFDVGLSVAFRCIDGSFNAVVAGLPPAAGDRRMLRLGFRDNEAYESMWTATTDASVVVGDFPAPLAREFRQGGTLRVTVPGGAADGRNLRYDVELPASNGAIDETLMACGRALVDPRDSELRAIGETGLPAGLTWSRAPRPRFPEGGRYASGFVVLTCINNADGSLRDCLVEMEHPHDSRFGRATLDAVGRARIQLTDQPDAPVPVRRVSFRTRYRPADDLPIPAGDGRIRRPG